MKTRNRRALEAFSQGQTREFLDAAVSGAHATADNTWVWVRDWTDEWVVFEVDAEDPDIRGTFRATYTIDEGGKVTLAAAEKVIAQIDYVNATEAVVQRITGGRVLEAKTPAGDGGRVNRVQIVAFGDSVNGRRYTESVVAAAAPLYEGAKAYDHHRSADEMRSSTINGSSAGTKT